MKILYVITKSERGGAQQHVSDLATAFHQQGNDVYVVIGEQAGWLHDQLHQKGISTYHASLVRTWNPLVFFQYMIDLARILKEIKPDVVHFHSSHTLPGAWIVRIFFPRIKSVATIHGQSILYPGASRLWVQSLYALFLKCVLWCADRVIFVSQFDQKTFVSRRLVLQERSEVIYNGIDAPNFLSRDEARHQLGLPKEAVVIGTLARFSFPKNISFLIESFALWNHPSALLCLMGSGSEEYVLKDLVQSKGLTDRVVFQKGDATLLKAFSCFVLSSRYEGFPYVLLEAALAEIPIVATQVGGVVELIENDQTGTLIPSGDVYALVGAMQHVVSETELSDSYAKNAHKRVEQMFTKRVMIEEISRAYHASLSNRL